MRILFFSDSLLAGGKERRLTELMKALILKPDIEFELVLMSAEIHYKEVFNLGIHIHYLLRNFKKDLSVFYKFYRICEQYKPDFIHCWDSMTAVIAVPACKLLNIKLINGMVTNTLVKQKVFNKHWIRAKLTFPFSSMVIGNSYAGLKAYNAPAKKSYCIYNGVDPARFDNLKEPSLVRTEIFGDNSDTIFIVGMVATFDERKDYKTLIRVAQELIPHHDELRFILIGNGDNFNEIKNSVPETLLNKIIFLGIRTDVESIVNIFDVGVLLTNSKVHGEGISNSILEYMALEIPVIATKSGGTTEVVEDNLTGFLVSPSNPEELTEKMKKLLSNADLSVSMGLKGKMRVQNFFTINKMVNNYISLISCNR
jgi:glycosyltransferase involved in cell wall biosynthesis